MATTPSTTRRPIELPGLTEELRADIEARITEFETQHEPDVLRGGAGWVPRVTRRDYAVAIAVNALFVIWLVIALAGG